MSKLSILRQSLVTLALGAFACAAGAAAPAADAHGHMQGFTDAGAAQQRQLENRFDALLSADDMRGWLQRLTAGPNQVGAPHNKANAEFILDKFKQWGWDAHIEKFDVLYPTPKRLLVELVAPTQHTATLHEPPVKGDRTSALKGVLPPYNAYSADGDVTAGLVYANYGMPDDYKQLARLGISVKGKIVIARYGHGWRGLKPRLADQHGAVGCIIYSDPRDDGYFRGDAYPQGGWKPAQGVQRGSVADQEEYYQGDPTTPGYGSVPGAEHLAVKDAKPIQNIPVLPISYADATPLLKALGGPVAPENWRGALPFTYHVGPGPAKVHLVVQSHWDYVTIYDVIAKLHGASDANQWVMRGNHHDAWVFGAYDPLAGTVAMMGEAKAMGALYQQGWRPRRTIVYASWDGEEPGLLGSTEWAETHADEIKRKAVLYVNSDTNARGFLRVGGSHSVQHMVNQVGDGVTDPETGVSVIDRLRARAMVRAAQHPGSSWWSQRAKQAAGDGDITINTLGSGSDFTPFLDHLGIASLSLGFRGENAGGGIYHSRYDSFDHYIRFGDPTLEYAVALAEMAGHVVMRTANAKVLPMRFNDVGAIMQRYVADLRNKIAGERKAFQRQQTLFAANAYQLTADPTESLAPPAALPDVPKIDLTPLDQAAQRLLHSAQAYQKVYRARAAQGLAIPEAQLQRINTLIGTMHQRLLTDAGLPTRPWYKNQLVAPGIYTGYGVKVFPAIRQALNAREWQAAIRNVTMVANTLDAYSQQLDELTVLLKQ